MADYVSELDAALRRRESAAALAAQVGSGGADRIAELHSRYGLGALSVPLGRAGVDDQTAKRVAAAKTRMQQRRRREGQETDGNWASKFWDGTVNSVKHVVRYGSAGAMFVPEVIQATARGIGQEVGIGSGQGLRGFKGTLKQTTIGAGVAEAHDKGVLLESLKGPFADVDEQFTGEGWFISPHTSKTGRRQAKEARASQIIDGHAGTLGRNLALPLDGGSWAHRIVSGTVDAAVYLTDPTARFGGKVAASNRTRRVQDSSKGVKVQVPAIDPAGRVDGTRPTVLPEKFASWLQADEAGGATARKIAAVDPDDPAAFNTIWHATGKKLPVDLVVKLVDARDPDLVKAHLAKAVSDGLVRETLRYNVKKPPPRIAGMMHQRVVDIFDPEDAVEQVDRLQRSVRFSEAEISRNNLAMARALSTGQRYQVVSGVLGVVERSLVKSGFTRQEARAVVRQFGDAREGNRAYHVELKADNAVSKTVRIGDTGHEVSGPLLSTELLDRYLPLPDGRALKNATRDLEWIRKAQASAPYGLSADFLDFWTQSLFKPFALVTRVAYPVRVIGEEQGRIAARGYASAFRKPLSYIALVIGDKPTRLIRTVDPKTGAEDQVEATSLLWSALSKKKQAPNLGGDAVGGRFDDEDLVQGVSAWQQAMNKDSGGWVDRVFGRATRHHVPIKPDEPEFVASWHNEIVKLASTPIARELARIGPERAKSLFWDGALQGERKQLIGALKDDAGRPIDLGDRAIADAYVDAVDEIVSKVTAGNHAVLQAVAHGRIDGVALTEGIAPSKHAMSVLEGYHKAGTHPQVVAGEVVDASKASPASRMAEHYDNAVQGAFRLLMTVPTNKLSRSPVFSQAYWQRMGEMIPLMSGSERAKLLRNAKDAGIPRAQFRQMRATAKAQDLDGSLTLNNADMVAKHYALGETRNLLYSLHDKSQAADALRVVFPFGEAWREVLTRWIASPQSLVAQNPNVTLRGLQAVPALERGGFFYPDPVTGQEMFGIPGSEWVTEKLTGVPMRLEAPVAGLNMFGTITPGVGPSVALLASKAIPDDPDWDFVRDQVLPFGDPDTSGGMVETLFPSWFRKVFTGATGGGSERTRKMLAASTLDVMAYLHSSGNYDLSDPADQQALLDDARQKARILLVIRGMAQSTAPSPPSTEFFVEDKTGRVRHLWELSKDYGKFLRQNPDTATERLINKWGQAAFLGAIGTTTGANAPTDRVNRFAREHPDQAKRFPDVYGLFAPGGEIDPAEISRQEAAGQRERRTPEQALQEWEQRTAYHLYKRAQERNPDMTDEERWAVQDQLKKRFPAYTGEFMGSSTPGRVKQLVAAAKDPVLAKTDAGKGLRLYVAARERAVQAALDAGVRGWDRAKSTAPLRAWLRDYAEWVIDRHGDFDEMWERVLSREVEEPDG